MKFKILYILLVIVLKFTFADTNTVDTNVEVSNSPKPVNAISENLRVTFHVYSYKLPLKQLNDILIANKIRPISVTEKIFYRDKLQNNDIPKMDSSFSKIADSLNNGSSICGIDGTICIFDEGIFTHDGKLMRLNIEFYPYIKNNQISIHVNSSDKASTKDNSVKNILELENVLGKNYVIGSCKQSGNLCDGQIMLVSFSSN